MAKLVRKQHLRKQRLREAENLLLRAEFLLENVHSMMTVMNFPFDDAFHQRLFDLYLEIRNFPREEDDDEQ